MSGRPRPGSRSESRSKGSSSSKRKKVATVVSVALVNVDMDNQDGYDIDESKRRTEALAEQACLNACKNPKTGVATGGTTSKPESISVAVGPDDTGSVCTCPETSERSKKKKPGSVTCSDNFLKNTPSKRKTRKHSCQDVHPSTGKCSKSAPSLSRSFRGCPCGMTCPDCREYSNRRDSKRRRRRSRAATPRSKRSIRGTSPGPVSPKSKRSTKSRGKRSKSRRSRRAPISRRSRRSTLSKKRKCRHPLHVSISDEDQGVNALKPQGTDRSQSRRKRTSQRGSPSSKRRRSRASQSKRTRSSRRRPSQRTRSSRRRPSQRTRSSRRTPSQRTPKRPRRQQYREVRWICDRCKSLERRRIAREKEESAAAPERREEPLEDAVQPWKEEGPKEQPRQQFEELRRTPRYKPVERDMEGQYTPTMESMGVRSCNCDECTRYKQKSEITTAREASPRRPLKPLDRGPSASPRRKSQRSVKKESSIRTARATTPKGSSRASRGRTPRAARATTPKGSSRASRGRTPRAKRSATPKLMDACPSGSLHSNFQIHLPPRQTSQPTQIPITRKSPDSSVRTARAPDSSVRTARAPDSSVRTARASTPKKSPPKAIDQSRSIKKPTPLGPLRKPAVAKKPSPTAPKRDTTVSTTTIEARRKVLANDMTSPTAHHTKTPVSSSAWLKDAADLRRSSPDAGSSSKTTETTTTTTTIKRVTRITTTPPAEEAVDKKEIGAQPPSGQPGVPPASGQPSAAPDTKPEAESKPPPQAPRLSPDYVPQRDYNPVCDCTNCNNLRQYRLEMGLCDCYDCIMALHSEIDTPSCREHHERLKRTPTQQHPRQAPRVRAKGSYPWVKRLIKTQQPGKPYGKAKRNEKTESRSESRTSDQSQSRDSRSDSQSTGTADSSMASSTSGYGTTDTGSSYATPSAATPPSNKNQSKAKKKAPPSSNGKYKTPTATSAKKKPAARKTGK